jgi:hypothetical protein
VKGGSGDFDEEFFFGGDGVGERFVAGWAIEGFDHSSVHGRLSCSRDRLTGRNEGLGIRG